jgi:GNAT superfamily N-acetyltransferase
MLEMRHVCERCEAELPADSNAAWICSYECTFCSDCTTGPLGWSCPNCGGDLHPRPPRHQQGTAGAPDPRADDNLTIRRAVVAEVSGFAALFDDYRMFYGKRGDRQRAEEFLRERVGRGQSLLFGAWRGGVLLGFCQIYPGFSSIAAARAWVLNDLYVLPEARRMGVANALLAASEQAARAAGVDRMSLQTAPGNEGARALYGRRGWTCATGFLDYEWSPR